MKKCIQWILLISILMGLTACSSGNDDVTYKYNEYDTKIYLGDTLEFTKLYLETVIILVEEADSYISATNKQSYIEIFSDLRDIAYRFVLEMEIIEPYYALDDYWEDAQVFFGIAGDCADNIVDWIVNGGSNSELKSYTDKFTKAVLTYYEPIYDLF